MKTKTDFFFELLNGVYGASKMSVTWPTDLDLQLAKKLWEDHINRHTEQELRGAITNAQNQIAKGEESFLWPNVGLILSGAKRCVNASHQVFLPAPEETAEQKAERKRRANEHLSNLKSMLNRTAGGEA